MKVRAFLRISISLHFVKYILLMIILAGFVGLCLGQYRSRTTAVRIIQLPKAKQIGSMSFEEALTERRQRLYQLSSEPLDITQIGQLAWAGLGLSEGMMQALTQSQASAATIRSEQTRPISIYFATQDGFYAYDPDEHGLQQSSNQDVRTSLAAATSNPEVVSFAGCDVIIGGSIRSIPRRSGSDPREIMLLQAGQVVEDIQLQAISMELGIIHIAEFDTNAVRRICNIPRTVEPLLIIAIGQPITESTSQQSGEEGQGLKERAVLVVPRMNFRDEELFETKRVLEAGGVQTVISSTTLGPIRGMLGGVADARILLDQIRVEDYDAVVFIGGTGAAEYLNNPIALNIAREAAHRGKILAAISTAPSILAQAGVISGYRITALMTERDNIVQAGAIYTGNAVERDRLIITASGPMSSAQFGRLIANALAGR